MPAWKKWEAKKETAAVTVSNLAVGSRVRPAPGAPDYQTLRKFVEIPKALRGICRTIRCQIIVDVNRRRSPGKLCNDLCIANPRLLLFVKGR